MNLGRQKPGRYIYIYINLVSRHSIQSNIMTHYRLRKREPLIALGSYQGGFNICIHGTPPWGRGGGGGGGGGEERDLQTDRETDMATDISLAPSDTSLTVAAKTVHESLAAVQLGGSPG